MPTIFELFGFRFFFASFDHLPIHVHVRKGDAEAKIYLEPELKVDYNHGFKSKEMSKILNTVITYQDEIIEAWKNNDSKK